MISRRGVAGIVALAALTLAPPSAVAQALKAFRLKFGDRSIDLNADEPVEIILPDGSKTTATLSRNPFLSYTASNFSFVHSSGLTVAKTDIGSGVIQHLMASALGTIVIVQQYPSADTSKIHQTMLNELTKETKAAGGKVSQSDTSRTLKNGKKLPGLKAIEQSGNDTADIEVLSFAAARPAILIVARMDRENAKQDAPMLERFWETLEIG